MSIRMTAVTDILAVGEPAAGALIGGATGVFTEPDDVNLGEPIRKWD